MLFSFLPESIIRQHDIHLNEWWDYCLIGGKDPIETNLSVLIGHLEEKLDAGASRDELKSIASSVSLIASVKMASQVDTLSFLFLEFAKYSAVNDTDDHKTSESQNRSMISSSHVETKKQIKSKMSSVQIKNVKKSKLSEVIDIPDDHQDNRSPSTSQKKPTEVLNNNVPTTSKNKKMLLQEAMDNSHMITSLMEFPSTKPPAVKQSILPELIDLSNDDSNTELPPTLLQNDVLNNNDQSSNEGNNVFFEQVIDNSQIITPLTESPTPTIKVSENNVTEQMTGAANGQELLMEQIQLINEPENDTINHGLPTETTHSQVPSILEMSNVVVETQSNSSNEKFSTIPIPFDNQEQNEAIQEQQSTLPPLTPSSQLNTSALECSNEELEQNRVVTSSNLQSELLVDTVQRERQQQHQLLSAKSPQHCNKPLLPQCQINEGALECLSQDLKEIKIETTENLPSELLLGNTVGKEQPQHQIPSANNNQAIDFSSNDVTTSVTSSVSTSYSKHAGIQFNEPTRVSLVKVPQLNINYIIQWVTDTIADSTKSSDVKDELSNDNNVLSDRQCLQDDYDGNNVHATSTVNIEEPKYIDGKSANHCRFLSIDFNRCSRCKKKIKNNPTTVHSTPPQKKNMLRDKVSIDKYYKKSLNSDTGNDEEDHNDNADDDGDDDDDDGDDDDWPVNNNKNTRKNQKGSILACRSVEIGSYKFTPKHRVIIDQSGLTLSVPSLNDKTKIVQVDVKHRHVVKVFIHSGKPIPILFFYINTTSALKIRKLLGMNSPKGPYYDPAAEDQTYKRIKLFPISLKSNSIMILQKLFRFNTVIEPELTANEVDDIEFSIDSSPEDPNTSSSNIDNRETAIDNTNNTNIIVENATGSPLKDDGTNANEENNEELNRVNDKVTAPVTIEQPKYVDGKLAVCRICGFASMDFNRCYKCMKKIPNNPKTKLDTSNLERKIHMTSLIDDFYKRLANNDIIVNDFDNDISPHTICSTSNSENSPDKDNTIDSDYKSEKSIENKNNNNTRKRLQVEVTAEERALLDQLSMPLIE